MTESPLLPLVLSSGLSFAAGLLSKIVFDWLSGGRRGHAHTQTNGGNLGNGARKASEAVERLKDKWEEFRETSLSSSLIIRELLGKILMNQEEALRELKRIGRRR